jgi:hypothetical protein
LTSKGAPTEMLATRVDKITYRAGSNIGIKALQRSRFCAGNKRSRNVKEVKELVAAAFVIPTRPFVL